MTRGNIFFGIGFIAVAGAVVLIAWSKYQASRVAHVWIGGDVHYGATTPRIDVPREGVGIVNLEGPVVDGDASKSEEKRLVNAMAGLRALAATGVRVVGIANNHARDVEPNETSKYAAAAKLTPAGGPKEGPLGIAGFASIETPAGRMIVVAYEVDSLSDQVMQKEIESAAREGDFLVATFHVNGPPSYIPRPRLRDAVEIALKAGALVVAAHGTHAVGPVERRPDGKVIAWGLGNLLFACDCSREKEGAILELRIDRDKNVKASIVPVEAGLDGAPARVDPEASLMFDLFASIKSSPLERDGHRAHF